MMRRTAPWWTTATAPTPTRRRRTSTAPTASATWLRMRPRAKARPSTGTRPVRVTPIATLSLHDALPTSAEDTPVTGSVTANDSTTSGGPLSFAINNDASHGTVVDNGNGSYTYTPAANFNGTDSFSYLVTDAASG